MKKMKIRIVRDKKERDNKIKKIKREVSLKLESIMKEFEFYKRIYYMI
jgi:hypothetical protein